MSKVTTWYLEMNSPGELIAARNPGTVAIAEAAVKQFQLNRFLYRFVGEAWGWTDRLDWSDEQWRDYAEADELRTWVALDGGSPAGYFELQKQAGQAVELCYFGLAQKFIGRGIGGHLLSEAIRQAWAWDAARVWVHTCSLDHPGALANYSARGMQVYRTEVE